MASVDKLELEIKVKDMYRDVALNPFEVYHFRMGKELALDLGYLEVDLINVPQEAIDSFAGVGYYFDLAELRQGETVLDLGSGSGMDVFIASRQVGEKGKIMGIDMTIDQLDKAERLVKENDIKNIELVKGTFEELPFEENTFDVVVSNGSINLTPNKEKLFKEVYKVLKPSGRLAISDIVTDLQLPDSVTCDSTLWASCIGGAVQIDSYEEIMTKTGFLVKLKRENLKYSFISKQAKGASKKWGVKSYSFLALKRS